MDEPIRLEELEAIRAAAAQYVANKVYRTCLCTLMLEDYYRSLNTGGGNARVPSGV